MRLATLALLAAVVSCDDEDQYEKFRIKQPRAYRQTPGAHVRDAGPFRSVTEGWLTDAQLDQAVDIGYGRFQKLFPELPVPNYAVWLVDDYVMWVDGAGWAGGVSYLGSGWIGVCIWSRVYTDHDPRPCFIARPPGNSFGTKYKQWRHTDTPLVPAIAHELLHVVIDDPQHKSPLWNRFSTGQAKAGDMGEEDYPCGRGWEP